MLFKKYHICICNMIILRFILGICPVVFWTARHNFHPIFTLQNENLKTLGILLIWKEYTPTELRGRSGMYQELTDFYRISKGLCFDQSRIPVGTPNLCTFSVLQGKVPSCFQSPAPCLSCQSFRTYFLLHFITFLVLETATLVYFFQLPSVLEISTDHLPMNRETCALCSSKHSCVLEEA